MDNNQSCISVFNSSLITTIQNLQKDGCIINSVTGISDNGIQVIVYYTPEQFKRLQSLVFDGIKEKLGL